MATHALAIKRPPDMSPGVGDHERTHGGRDFLEKLRGPLAKLASSDQRTSTSAQYKWSSTIQPMARCSTDSPLSKSTSYLFSRCQRMKVESARPRNQESPLGLR